MASGDREKPQCRVCRTVFTFKGPEPLLLPCLHPACKPCVDSTGETITCDICQQQFDKGDYAFPKHFILTKDLFQSAMMNSPSDIICTNRSDGAKAETWCPTCEAYLCYNCQEFHKESKATRSHGVESLLGYLESENKRSKILNYCEKHPDHPLVTFDDSCQCLVCYKCLRFYHSNCSVEDVDKVFGKMKESELDSNIKQIVSRLDDITDLEQEAQAMAKKIDKNSKRVQEEVTDTFSDIRKTLEMREKMIIQETSKSFIEVQNSNTEVLKILKEEKTRCETALSFMKRSKEISDPVQALTMKKMIDERTRVCTEADLMEIDGRESSICLSTQDLQDIKQTIETFAGLYSVYDEDSVKKVISGPTTKEKQNKRLNELQEEVEELRCREQGPAKGKIDLEIPFISAIASKCSFNSKIKHINNMPWYLSAQFSLRNEILMLGLFLYPSDDATDVFGAGKKWTCQVEATFEITSSSPGISKRKELGYEYSTENNLGRGYSSIISKKELQESSNHFLRGDCVSVSVDVEILHTTGFC